MKERQKYERDVDECSDKIRSILSEYRCYITLDNDLGICVCDEDAPTMDILVKKSDPLFLLPT